MKLLSAILLLVPACTLSGRGLVGEDHEHGDGAPDGEALDQRSETREGTPDVAPDRPADAPSDAPPDAPADRPAPLALGLPCAAGMACASGFCVDGVCCDTACAGACQACAAARTGAASGTCRPIPAAMDPDSECADDGMASCKRTGACDGKGACALYPKGTACAAASCSGRTLTAPSCDGAGACAAGVPAPCPGGFSCANAQSCKTTCAFDADCGPDLGCDRATGQCSVMKKPPGQPCTTNVECLTNVCADGVCCNLACTGQCRACVEKLTGNKDGICANITAGLKPTRESDCPAEKSTCGNTGLCDGAGACQQFADGTQCGTYCCNRPGPGNSAAFCHLLCFQGACRDESDEIAGTCQDTDPCTRDECQTMGTGHTCRSDGGCGGPNGCCCVGILGAMCTDRLACVAGLGGVCAPVAP